MFKDETPKSIFEIGCANGGLLKDLTEHYPDLKVGGVDISESVLKARETFPLQAENFLIRDISDPWPQEDQSWDIIFSVGVLMYSFDPLPALREMFRVGKKVVLAEYHHSAVGLGQMTQVYVDNGKIHMGIIRNYISLLKLLQIPLNCTFQESGDKTIIKCEIQK